MSTPQPDHRFVIDQIKLTRWQRGRVWARNVWNAIRQAPPTTADGPWREVKEGDPRWEFGFILRTRHVVFECDLDYERALEKIRKGKD